MAEKVIKIGGRNTSFKVDGFTPVKYMEETNNDFMGDFLKFEKAIKGIGNVDTMAFYRMAYITAKQSDAGIGSMKQWLSSFDEFPIFDVVAELMPLLQKNFMSNKKDKLVRKK
ncbi:hypothetical protein ACIQZG_04520 [Lysinibacillus sp. NPDC096418]|uniref:hypothetical protein n=1 Tax=Lysinibacillus sp. NPDC096418 TaxID=3364138 RepID=UPI0038281B1E